MRFPLLGLLLLALAACSHANRREFGGPGTVAGDAAAAAIVGVTAAGVSRAMGGCYAGCPPGTFCNNRSGLCDELPCRGRCNPDEHCELTATSSKCVSDRLGPEIEIGRKAADAPTSQGEKPPSP
jgi:hypothetical protein